MRNVAIAALAACLLAWRSACAFEAGAAKVEITPPLGTPLNGYGDRLGRGAVDVHDPVWARCLYLSDGATAVLLVSADLCVINPELRDRTLELAPREVPPENIILCATHTHSAQGGMIRPLLFRTVSGRFVPEVLEQTAQGLAAAMRAALANRTPAGIGYGTVTQQDLSVNRRIDNGPVDPQIGVIRVDDAESKPLAILANFAAHPTTVGGKDQFSVSGDYPGYYCAELEMLAGGKCVALFTNGAEGNQRTRGIEGKDGWARTEAIGKALAQRVKEAADQVTCRDAKLHVGAAAARLPLTMGEGVFPAETRLQTLEIDDLLLTFVPGEPCVEIGLSLRRLALSRGYAAQFTVGLSNDYLGYFVPPDYYSQYGYENSMGFYGPLTGDWFAREFGKLMTRGESAPAPVASTPGVDTVGGADYVVLEGTAYEIGYQRGAAFRNVIAGRYATKVVDAVKSGALMPQSGYWGMLSPYLDLSAYALLALGVGARPLLQGAAASTLQEIQGLADGSGLPFDAAWLVQCLPTVSAQSSPEPFYRTAFCTMVASIGDRAGVENLLVGRNLDWTEDGSPAEELAPVIAEVRPTDGGLRYVQVGFPWNVGVFSGMNEAGLVVCAERVPGLGTPGPKGAPVDIVLRELLSTAKTMDEAAKRLGQSGLRGYHVLVGDPSGPSAGVVELGASMTVRRAVKGLLLGADPASSYLDEGARLRYTRLAELLEKEHIVSSSRLRSVLQDSSPDVTAPGGAIWNGATRHSVVFEPRSRQVRVAFPDASRAPGKYTSLSLQGGGS